MEACDSFSLLAEGLVAIAAGLGWPCRALFLWGSGAQATLLRPLGIASGRSGLLSAPMVFLGQQPQGFADELAGRRIAARGHFLPEQVFKPWNVIGVHNPQYLQCILFNKYFLVRDCQCSVL